MNVFLENVKYLENNAFASDKNLSKEEKGFLGRPLEIVLISSNNKCGLCDHCWWEQIGPAFQWCTAMMLVQYLVLKYCQNNYKGTQHYGFYTRGSESDVIYDDD